MLAATISVSRIRGIAFHPNGTLFGVVDGRLYEIDSSTGKAAQIGLSSGARYAGLSSNPFTNKLYAADITQDKIYTLNPITGEATLVGSTGLGVGNYAIAFSPEGILYGITRTNNFISIDATTGAGTLIGQMSFAGMSALAMRTDAVLVNVDTEHESPLPATYQLEQNYPNPFNPSTTIRYSLPKSQFVTLKIFNMTGQEMTTLMNRRQEAREHRFRWNAEKLPSGVYMYRLQAGEFVETKKMVLLR